MKTKERLLAAIAGRETDRTAWSPFLAYYWEFLHKDVQVAGQVQYLQSLGADPLLRGFHTLYRAEYPGEKRETTDGRKRTVEYSTPVGKLTEEYTFAQAANTWFLTRHPVQNTQDMAVLVYLFENMRIYPDDDAFLADDAALGDDGLYLPVIGVNGKTAFQSLLEHWVGTEQLVYFVYDEPEWVQTCLDAMRARSLETVRLSVQTPAKGFITWEDTSTTNISPGMFSQYIAPELNAWADIIHDAGKLLVHHACGHLKDLLPLMAETRVDCVESISPPPTGNVAFDAAAKILAGGGLSTIGGIEPTVLLNSKMDELRVYTENLLEAMKGYPFILANSDSCPPGVAEEKFKMITELVISRKR